MADITLTIDGVTKGLELARERGRKVWREEDAVAVPSALVGAASYEAMQPSQVLVLGQREWRGGFGRLFFLEPDRYADASGIDTGWQGRVFLGPLLTVTNPSVGADFAAPPLKFAFFKGSEYLITSNKVYRFNGTTWDEVLAIVGDIFSDLEVFQGEIYAGLTTGKYYYSTTGNSGSWTQTSLPNAVAHFFIRAVPTAGATPIFVLAKRPNEVRTATRATDVGGDWTTTPFYMGDSSADVTGLMLFNEFLLVGKEDGLYTLSNDGRSVELLPEFKVARSSRNFQYHAGWQSSLYFSVGPTLGEISYGGGYRTMGPFEGSNLEQSGSCVGLSADAHWLYAAFSMGSGFVIYKGRERRSREGLRWEWCPWINLGATAVQALRVMQRSGQNVRLWMGYGNKAAYVVLSDNPLADSAYRFAAQGYLVSGWFHAGYEVWKKIFTAFRVLGRDLSAGQTVRVYSEADDAGTWTLIGTGSSSGVQVLYPSSPIAASKVRLKIELNTNDSTTTPIVEGYWLKGVLRPELIRVFTFAVTAEQGSAGKAKSVYDFLLSGRSSTNLIDLKDRMGVQHKVVFLPGSPRVVEVADEAGREPTMAVQVAAQKVETA